MTTFREAQRIKKWERMKAGWTELQPETFGDSVLVFAPHPDDETLGCGGTILRLRANGKRVRIVAMTDGGASHAHLMPEEELIALRKKELLEATALLNIPAEDVLFLDFPDQTLGRYKDDATEQVKEIIQRTKATTCFVPFHGDDHTDHKATNRFVRSAVFQLGQRTEVYGYPIWFWMRWPWIPIWEGLTKRTLRGIKNTYFAVDGIHRGRDFTHAVSIEGWQEKKRRALHAHRTQMEALNNNADWVTLTGVGAGQFVERFFESHEVFHKYQLADKTSRNI